MKKKVLVVGFEEFDERMYPHLHDVLNCLKGHFDLEYYGGDDRGFLSYQKGLAYSKLLNPAFPLYLYRILKYGSRIAGIKKELVRLFHKDFDIVIAIDHSALDYVGRYIKKGTRLIFWSHDILTQDHIWMENSHPLRRLVERNKGLSAGINLVIVQDPSRAAVLDSVINTHRIKKFYLPVSLFPDDFSINVSRIKSEGLLKERTQLMQVGSIHEFKSSDDILRSVQELGNDIELTFMGHISPSIRKLAGTLPVEPVFCDVQPSLLKMREIVSRADIGVIGAKHKNLNNHFYSMAVGQLVEFSRLGIPVIVVDSEELGKFVESQGCGIYAKDLRELKNSVDAIRANYPDYSVKSVHTYRTYYDLSIYSEGLVEAITG